MDVNDVESVYKHQGNDEDDVFFDEIRRQILVLTADDEDHQETDVIDSVSFGANKPGRRRTVGNPSSLQHGSYFSWPGTKNTDSVPTWLVNLWRTGNGTGVFIPHINKPTKCHRPGRVNRRRVYRLVETKQS
ncbi:BZIP transcription factor family protein isoform 1 [Hibiscus syriacus]|uniref:BZIP transcription factor family protein isoform 1 n=1 Tax=Hibiscus syriacus TaxID=106335 RepID=A0A6A2WMK7_HIBSY|nr:BZIP transcription factor family protein isoform 1 [Hibiscus syriacus]